MCFLYFIILLLPYTKSRLVHKNFPEFNRDINISEINVHLNYNKIIKICDNREDICRSNDTSVCAARQRNNLTEYKDFKNSCFLFMNNMCENPSQEFHIASSGITCVEFLKSRRHGIEKVVNSTANMNHSGYQNTTIKAKEILREPTTISAIYDIDTAYDYHLCPLTCPDTYSPVCVCVNRGFGLHFKFYTFVNHCEADRYYCKNWEEFSPPPDEDEKIQSSKLSWSYCGASRYLQFARFSEVASSLGHYGWLDGDYRYSHIMEPRQRKPGYG